MSAPYTTDYIFCDLCDTHARGISCEDCDTAKHCEYCGEFEDCEVTLDTTHLV